MYPRRRSAKYYAFVTIFLLLMGGVWLISNLSKRSDPLIFEHEDKTLNFHVTSFYGGMTFEIERTRDMSFEIINSSEVLIYCKESSTNYMLFDISLKNDTYDVNIEYFNEFGVDLSRNYFDLGYNNESEFSLIQDYNGEATSLFMSIEGTLLIST
ncbi:MAG: hypothetical protein ACTSQ5_02905 [Promethearchaeota archaeon]